MTPRLASAHAPEIDFADRLVDFRVLGRSLPLTEVGGAAAAVLVVGVAEARAPVCEVGADHEGVGGVGEVGREEGAERPFRGGGGVAYHYGDEGWEGGAVGAGCC